MSCKECHEPYPELPEPVQHALCRVAQDPFAMQTLAEYVMKAYAELPDTDKHTAFAHPNFDHKAALLYYKSAEISAEQAMHQVEHFISRALAPRMPYYTSTTGEVLSVRQAVRYYAAQEHIARHKVFSAATHNIAPQKITTCT